MPDYPQHKPAAGPLPHATKRWHHFYPSLVCRQSRDKAKLSLFWRQRASGLQYGAVKKTIYAEEYRELVEWLREARKRKGITMRELAKKLGVHHSWVGRIEQGERRLDILEFARVCKALGCNPYDGLKFVKFPVAEIPLKKVAESRSPYGSRSHR